MGRKSSNTVMKSKQVAIDNRQINVRKCEDKNTKRCTDSVS